MSPPRGRDGVKETIHEFYIMEILKEYREELETKFGPGLMKLRKKFNKALSSNGTATEQGSDK